ncbi:hypothetical protein V3Q77_07230 [Flavobacterium davisii]|uniref:Tim44-like domain-containing protein n=1 Tax=Flavobacterium davisii TaxID=2906077 RepID=A0ABW8PRL0_9FLAO
MKIINKLKKLNLFIFLLIGTTLNLYARLGGGGGRSSRNSHSSSRSSGGHYSGGHYSGGHYSDGHYNYNSESSSTSGETISIKYIVLIVILILIYQWYKMEQKKKLLHNTQNISDEFTFPEGLTESKVRTAFLEMQKAWQNQNLSNVRKWMSDGLYQKLSVQIKMMQKLAQHNEISNLNILEIKVKNIYTYNDFQIVDIKIAFKLDDLFYSDKYKTMREFYEDDYAVEYYTFIKKGNTVQDNSNLYSNTNCPNCGTEITTILGEISRCNSCNTLTNNPTYDWILCEITQEENYRKESPLNYDTILKEKCTHDSNFNIQSVEDVASNICMQILEVITGGNEIKLERFAHKEIRDKIISYKNEAFNNVVFERLYIKELSTKFYKTTNDNKLEIHLYAEVCGKRVRIEKDKLIDVDNDLVNFSITLSLIKEILEQPKTHKEVVFSYECPNCGAPYDDTTHDTCNYCESVVVDESNNWVLNNFNLEF